MSTLQKQNTQIDHHNFLPVQRLVLDSTVDPKFNQMHGTTELGFKIPNVKHSDSQISPALDFQKFNPTNGLRYPVSNMSINDYYLINPAFSQNPDNPQYNPSEYEYPGMMTKSSHFHKQSDVVLSDSLRTPAQSRILTNAQAAKLDHSNRQHTPIQYPDEIKTHANHHVWDNNNRIKKSCSDIHTNNFSTFNLPVPHLIENNRISNIMVNSRDVMRNVNSK